jgi:hypothetical protein
MKQQENIKDQISKIKNTFKKSNFFNFLFIVLIFALLFFNLAYSQLISPLYFRFISSDKNATVTFLEKIKTFPEFQNILEMNNIIYDKTVKKEIFQKENEKKMMINNLEQKLLINPKSRDVLYSVYKVYLSEGNVKMAEKYLKLAKEIDPSL